MNTRRFDGVFGQRSLDPVRGFVEGRAIKRSFGCRQQRARDGGIAARCERTQVGTNRLGWGAAGLEQARASRRCAV